MRVIALLLLVMLVLAGAVAGTGLQPAVQPAATAPAAPSSPAILRIRGAGVEVKDLDLSMAEFKSMPHRTVTIKEKDDKTTVYSGVTAEDVLTKAGVAFGHALRGPRMREYLVAEATDGYGVVFAMQEIATEFSDRVVLIADTIDGKPLDEKNGPLKIVVSDEKKHARWVRNLNMLTVRTCAEKK